MCSRDKMSKKDLNDWSYKDQSEWTKFPNFYSVNRIPINIDTSKVINCQKKSDNLQIDYQQVVTGKIQAADENDIPIFYPNLYNNFLYYNSKKYTLINFHYHNASENTIDGEYFPVELHFVHKYTEDNIDYFFVLGILLKIVEKGGLEITNNFFTQIGSTQTYNLSIFNNLSSSRHYEFMGTLTTPPFYENTLWALYNTYDVNYLNLAINKKSYDEYIHNFINTKANVQCQYQNSRYVNKCKNFLSIKRIN